MQRHELNLDSNKVNSTVVQRRRLDNFPVVSMSSRRFTNLWLLVAIPSTELNLIFHALYCIRLYNYKLDNIASLKSEVLMSC